MCSYIRPGCLKLQVPVAEENRLFYRNIETTKMVMRSNDNDFFIYLLVFLQVTLASRNRPPTFHFLVRWRLIFRRKRLVTAKDYRGLKREQSPHLSLLQLSHSLRQSAAATLLPLAAAAAADRAALAPAATLTHSHAPRLSKLKISL